MANVAAAGDLDRSKSTVVFASSLGTVFEWYDFYLYGSLAAIISKQFFSGVNETAGFIFALAAFAAGFGHLGRAAAAYRERFGEAPSETLRRRL